ncbi:hypothetical protein ABG067_006979 [Albugo candida]|uniref:Roadblock/LAMTOR2 domain-containing protein n=1 Tax=Albugo candida TaxID=65357 RepID=A0A024G6W6_9STRA|nr:unnamed protein product [Albugo candida]|eukprot:CCI42488.1 unnamed protein product [Albugo candida]
MAANIPNEIDEAIKQLKSKPGFAAYLIMSNDGIVVRYENLEYREAVMYAYHVLALYARARKQVAKIMGSTLQESEEMEWLRLKTKLHEMIIAQHLRYTLVVLQTFEDTVITPDVSVARGVSALEEPKEKQDDKSEPKSA